MNSKIINSKNSTHTCAQEELSLMTLFDGEEDVHAETYRQHLAECDSCAQRWQEWQELQENLQSLPVPAVPPAFSQQLLLRSQNEQPELRTALTDYLEAPELETSQTESESFGGLSGLIATPPVPAQLQSQIMRATAAKETPVRQTLQNVVSAWFEKSHSHQSYSHKQSALRWSAALAFPALAAGIILISQSQSPLSVPDFEGASLSKVAPVEQQIKNPQTQEELRSAEPVAKSPTLLEETASTSKVLLEETRETKTADKPSVSVAQGALSKVSKVRKIQSGNIPFRSTANVPAEKSLKSVRKNSSQTQSSQNPSRAERHIPAVAKVDLAIAKSASPRLTQVSLVPNRNAVKAIRPLPRETEPQISVPQTAPTMPSLQRFVSSEFDEIFIAILQERDNRPADLRRVFDEYHVALLSEDSDYSDDL